MVAYTTPMLVVAYLPLRAMIVSAESDRGASTISWLWPVWIFGVWCVLPRPACATCELHPSV